MPTDTFKTGLTELFPTAVLDEKGQYLAITIEAEHAHELIRFLKEDAQPPFEKLACLSGVDWLTHLEIVYHLDALTTTETIVVKCKIADRENPVADSISDLWKGADLLECEVYDYFGVHFNNHPFLRRLFLGEEWTGYPLRKDYVDEINMITL